jgi:plastocyanin
MRRPRKTLTALVLPALLVLGACGDDDTTTTTDDTGTGSTMPMGGDMDHGGGDADHREASPVADGARRIEVEATSFEFDPDGLTATVGEDIAIVLSSEDLLHDLTIDELDAHVAADRGETEEGGFTADQPGEYTFYCSVEGHRDAGMEGTLTVEEA